MMSETEKQQLVDAVAQATRTGLAQVPPERLDAGWQKLERALSDGKYPSVPIVRARAMPWYLRGIVFASMILAVGIVAAWVRHQRAQAPLRFALEGASAGPSGSIQAGADAPAQLVFSDQSRVRLLPAAKVSVSAMDSHGACVSLAAGDLEVFVKPRAGNSWRFDAGPFTVSVKGTSFHLGFDARRGRFGLQMHEGVVEVTGPSRDRKLTLRTRESLELFAAPVTTDQQARAGVSGKLDMLAEPTALSPSAATAVPPAKPADAQPAFPGARLPPRRAHPKGGEPSEDGQRSEPWSQLIARGEFAAVVRDAEDRGLEVALARASAAELTALADAARYTRRYEVARQALLRVRERFPASDRSRDAAFFLGRLAEAGPSAATALTWYETYLYESERGPFAAEALGREMTLLSRTGREQARAIARQYLERFPRGSQADLARSLVQSAVR